MSSTNASLTGTSTGESSQLEQAVFDGMMVAALAYGALIMLYIQIIQVMLRRPKRDGRIFWFIVIYSTVLFPLTTFAFVGKFKLSEQLYVALPSLSGGPSAFWTAHSEDWPNVMSEICTTIIPWFGDLIMIYRLAVIWNYKRSVLVIPSILYLGRVGLSFPLLVAETHTSASQSARKKLFGLIFYSLCLSLNLIVSTLICVRLYIMRHKAERVLGTLQASLYNSSITMFVESGLFFTAWSMAYVISLARRSWVQNIFLEPYPYMIALTRMLIVLRMAQGRAWSKEIINAADEGVLDWQVNSTHSVGLMNMSENPEAQNLPKKFREDSLGSKSTINRKV